MNNMAQKTICFTVSQTFVLTPATYVVVDWSVVQPTTNYTYVKKSTNVYVLNIFHHIINY